MLKTNSKKAKENLRSYIIESTHHDDESPAENWETAKTIVKNNFEQQKLHDYNLTLIRSGRARKYDIFKDWLQGLPSGGLGDYWYFCNAVEILGNILEETETERNRFTEDQAAEKLSLLIYNIIY